jgi:hypothetical protein
MSDDQRELWRKLDVPATLRNTGESVTITWTFNEIGVLKDGPVVVTEIGVRYKPTAAAAHTTGTAMRPLSQAEYDWEAFNPDGSVEHGKLMVDSEGIVRFVPDRPLIGEGPSDG